MLLEVQQQHNCTQIVGIQSISVVFSPDTCRPVSHKEPSCLSACMGFQPMDALSTGRNWPFVELPVLMIQVQESDSDRMLLYFCSCGGRKT